MTYRDIPIITVHDTPGYNVRVGCIEKPLYNVSFGEANNYAHSIAILHGISTEAIDIRPMKGAHK